MVSNVSKNMQNFCICILMKINMCTRLFLLCQIQRFMCNYKSFNIEVLKDQKLFELYLPLWQHSTFCNYIKLLNQSVYKPQIRTSPRAAQQGRIKCKWHITVPMVSSQEAISEEGKKYHPSTLRSIWHRIVYETSC